MNGLLQSALPGFGEGKAVFAEHVKRQSRGFRLSRVELLNWGMFDGKVAVVSPAGGNMLVTGDNGSGKSTIVDALTTLFASSNQVPYNAASGGKGAKGDRSIDTYVEGVYGETEDPSGKKVRLSLRGDDPSFYSAVLAVFEDGPDAVTLAQVFRPDRGKPGGMDKLFVLRDGDMSIANEFSYFGSFSELKKRLRLSGAQIFDSFKQYQEQLRRVLRIESEQAIKLFLQTVYMKTVDNLDRFIKDSILEPVDADEAVESLLSGFESLTALHEEIRREKRKLEHLEPLAARHKKYMQRLAERNEVVDSEATLEAWRLRALLTSLENEKSGVEEALALGEKEKVKISAFLEKGKDEVASISASIAGSGGSRIRELEREAEAARSNMETKLREARRFVESVSELLGEGARLSVEEMSKEHFDVAAVALESSIPVLSEKIDRLDSERAGAERAVRELDATDAELSGEIESLKSRQGNMDSKKIEVRRKICSELGVDESEFPFVGELVEVADSEWENACEKIMRNFAQDILVPERRVSEFSRCADARRLGMKLVWHSVPESELRRSFGTPLGKYSGSGSALCEKVRINEESPFSGWVFAQLERRFPHVCCDDVGALERVEFGVLRSGVEKKGKVFGKDDRDFLNDRKNYVLGWNNSGKIESLETELSGIRKKRRGEHEILNSISSRLEVLRAERKQIESALARVSFGDVDWISERDEVERKTSEKRKLEESSDVLRTLSIRLESVKSEVSKAELRLSTVEREMGGLENELSKRIETDIRRVSEKIASSPKIEQSKMEEMERLAVEHESSDSDYVGFYDTMRTKTAAKKTELEAKTASDRVYMAQKVAEFRAAFPEECRDLLAGTEDVDEYLKIYERVVRDALPGHELRFADMVRKNVAEGVSMLQDFFNRQEQEIKDRIAGINVSLASMEYNPGTRIEIKSSSARKNDADIRKFRDDLKRLVSGMLGESDRESAARFELAREMLDKLKGREGQLDSDRAWRRRVTDIRNWFEFGVLEKDRTTGETKASYSSSNGKSGGQKEKLASTVLAAGIAYVFGLGKDIGKGERAPFRTIVVDEAFSKGSPEFAEYVLELFSRLGVQFIVVTPLTQLKVIENFVSSVGYVESDEEKRSRIRTLSIKHYRAEMQKRVEEGEEDA